LQRLLRVARASRGMDREMAESQAPHDRLALV